VAQGEREEAAAAVGDESRSIVRMLLSHTTGGSA
jgi:hypothetical protein